MVATTQADLVRNFLNEQSLDKDTTEKLFIPNLDQYFLAAPQGSVIQKESIKIPNLAQLGYQPRKEVAKVLLNIIQHKSDIVGIEWNIVDAKLTISYVKNFQQRKIPETTYNDLVDILSNILKARPSLLGLQWNLGMPRIELRYLAQ